MQTLQALSQKAQMLSGVQNLLGWDQETYMPKGASAARADQLELIAGLLHEMKTGPAYQKALDELIDIKTEKVKLKNATEEQKAARREWRRDFVKDTSLPTAFVQEFSQLGTLRPSGMKKKPVKKARSKNSPLLREDRPLVAQEGGAPRL